MNRVDVEKLNDKELLRLQDEISSQLVSILNKTDKDINEILSKYGLKAQILFELKKDE
jgi:hypothetical protein